MYRRKRRSRNWFSLILVLRNSHSWLEDIVNHIVGLVANSWLYLICSLLCYVLWEIKTVGYGVGNANLLL